MRHFRKHNILLSIGAMILFLSAIITASYITKYLTENIQFFYNFRDNFYLLSAFNELIILGFTIVLMVAFGKIWVLKDRGLGFLYGAFWCGGFFIVLSLIIILGNSKDAIDAGVQFKEPLSIVGFVAYYMLVGLSEEFLFRGIIGEYMMDKFIMTKYSVIKACFATGILFGAIHLTNLATADTKGVIVQSILAVFVGAVFTAIYYRCGNIWAIAFIHGLNDIAADFVNGVFQTNQSIVNGVSKYTSNKLIAIGVYLILFVFLTYGRKSERAERLQIRRRNIHDVSDDYI